MEELRVIKIMQDTENRKATHKIDTIKAGLKPLQEFVGGYIEAPFLSEKLTKKRIVAYINEMGKLVDGFIPTLVVEDSGRLLEVVVGNILLVGTDGRGNDISLSEEQILFLEMEILQKRAMISNKELESYLCYCIEVQ